MRTRPAIVCICNQTKKWVTLIVLKNRSTFLRPKLKHILSGYLCMHPHPLQLTVKNNQLLLKSTCNQWLMLVSNPNCAGQLGDGTTAPLYADKDGGSDWHIRGRGARMCGRFPHAVCDCRWKSLHFWRRKRGSTWGKCKAHLCSSLSVPPTFGKLSAIIN